MCTHIHVCVLCVCVCVCMFASVYMCVSLYAYVHPFDVCVCLAFRVMLNGMTKVDTPLLVCSSSLGRPIGAPRVF